MSNGNDVWYTALFVVEPNRLTKLFPPKHKKVFAHHSTIAFEPETLEGIEIGKRWNVKILGRATDEKGMKNLISEYNVTSTRTSISKKEERHADYIFVSPEVVVNRFEVLKDEVSDHSPLLLDFS